MKKCHVCGKEILDFDTVIDGMYVNLNGKFDTVELCKDCYKALDKSRMKNDVEFIRQKRKKIQTNQFNVGDIVYFITCSPLSAAHPFVFNKQIEVGIIAAIKIKITEEKVDYKYIVKRNCNRCYGTYSEIYKTKEEAKNNIQE